MSLDRRRKRNKYQRLLAIDVQEGLSLRGPPSLEVAPEQEMFRQFHKIPTACWMTTVGLPSSTVAYSALDSTVIKAPSTSKWSVLVQGKDFPEVASPSLSPRPLVGAP